jgi:hypothetical protein
LGSDTAGEELSLVEFKLNWFHHAGPQMLVAGVLTMLALKISAASVSTGTVA